jgi:maltoporin
VGESTIATLNRQRMIASAKLEYWKQVNDTLGFKVKGYGEFHQLPQGTYNALGEPEERIDLPAESGFVAGLQGGLWGFSPYSFVNVFARYASGIAAYGEFSQPLGLGWMPDLSRDYSAAGARDFVLAAVGNYVIPGRLGVQLGAYWRTFEDADGQGHDWDDGNELVVALRPMLLVPEWFGRQFALAGEVSYQRTERAGLHPETDLPAPPCGSSPSCPPGSPVRTPTRVRRSGCSTPSRCPTRTPACGTTNWTTGAPARWSTSSGSAPSGGSTRPLINRKSGGHP